MTPHSLKIIKAQYRTFVTSTVGQLWRFYSFTFLLISFGLFSCSSTPETDTPENEDGFSAFDEAAKPQKLSESYLPEEKEVLGVAPVKPKIYTRSFDVKVIRPSRTGKIYLIENKTDELPQTGRVILLKQNKQPAMGFKVLKTYPSSREFAAKKIRTYPGHETLDQQGEYRAFEKVGDVAPPPPVISDGEQQDIDELEKEENLNEGESTPAPVDPITGGTSQLAPSTEPGFESFAEQDSGQDKKKSGKDEPLTENDFQSPEDAPTSDEKIEIENTIQTTPKPFPKKQQDLEINNDEEHQKREYFPNRITLDIGLIRSPDLPVGSSYSMSAGVLLSRKLSISRYVKQNGLALEGGLSYYKVSGVVTDDLGAETTKSFTVIPIRGTLRYDYYLNDSLELYLYGGLHYHQVAANLGVTDEEMSNITRLTPALGVGAFLVTGPSWYLRLNLGYDSWGIGAALKF